MQKGKVCESAQPASHFLHLGSNDPAFRIIPRSVENKLVDRPYSCWLYGDLSVTMTSDVHDFVICTLISQRSIKHMRGDSRAIPADTLVRTLAGQVDVDALVLGVVGCGRCNSNEQPTGSYQMPSKSGSPRAASPNSRPLPDCLYPPKGIYVEMMSAWIAREPHFLDSRQRATCCSC
jgi:hypothetical protein